MSPTRRMMKTVFGLFVLLLLSVTLSTATVPGKKKTQGAQKVTDNNFYTPFLINNVFNYYGNNGDGCYSPYGTDEGFEFPIGSGLTCIYEDGVVWGGFVHDSLRVGGSTYSHGVQAGKILPDGTSDDGAQAKYRIFRVRPDIKGGSNNADRPSKLADVEANLNSTEVPYIGRYTGATAQSIYNQYVQDWNEWPADQGAPFTDVNGDGIYDPNVDIPGKPGADQTLWYVTNDLDPGLVADFSGSRPIGLEMQKTIWGYKRKGALGNTIFAASLLINRGGAEIDSMFLVQWADPDLGDATDDFVGCDSARSLGYVYNGNPVDGNYGVSVPAAGFDFFQGPLVPSPGDSAIFQGHERYGFKNLPMSAFDFFSQGIAAYTDPRIGTGGDVDWYNLMNGLIAASGTPFIDPNTGIPTKFCLSGDPATQTGWVDGQGGLTPQDRRMCLVTGPFKMAAGDTQELVVANLGGRGSDRYSSIALLKANDDKAQATYDNFFKVPAPPPSPKVSVAEMDQEVILTWGDPVAMAKTEGTVDQEFAFEGYKVYEFPGPSATGAFDLGTFDVVDGIKAISDTGFDVTSGLNLITIVQQGTDNGVIRSLDITNSKATGKRLSNDNRYYFAITAFSYNPNPPASAGTHSLEDPFTIITVIPHKPTPGTRYLAKAGDAIPATLTMAAGAGSTDGSVAPVVVDPTKVTGHKYKVTFGVDTTTGGSIYDVSDATLGKVVAAAQTNQSGDANYPIIDGLSIKVVGPPPGMKSWGLEGTTRHISPVGGNGLGLEGFSTGGDPNAPQDPANGSIGMGANFPFASTTLSATGYHNVQLRAAVVDPANLWDPTATPADANFSLCYRYLRAATAAPADPSFVPWIINAVSGYAYQDYIYGVPLSAWDMETTPPTRLAMGHLENNVTAGRVDGRWWPDLTSTNNTASTGPREWLFIFASPYTATPQAQYQVNFSGSVTDLMWVVSAARRNDTPWADGDVFDINAYHVNAPADTFSFTAPTVISGNKALAQADVTKINVFPNPYIGFNPQETDKYGRWVTFTHLPTNATIRIFSLAGILVRTIQKSNQTQSAQWDLNNDYGFPVAAGMYIVYINMPDLGETKTLKLGIVPEQQYLDRY